LLTFLFSFGLVILIEVKPLSPKPPDEVELDAG